MTCPRHGLVLTPREAPVFGGTLLMCPDRLCEYSRMPATDPQKAVETPPEPKPNKYRNYIVIVDGVRFDSQKEADYWATLQQAARAGKISDLRRQVRYDFVVNGVNIGFYKADMTYIDDSGNVVVVDVKSEFTRRLPVYRIKKKLMLALYSIEIQEV